MDELTDISGIITDELPVDNNLGIDKFWVATNFDSVFGVHNVYSLIKLIVAIVIINRKFIQKVISGEPSTNNFESL